jgi:hypothetical protein
MISEHVREARSACERQFSFLATEFGYRKVRSRFKWHGFELRYRGPLVGIVVEWFPRDPLTVRLTPLVNGDFQSNNGFDLGDIESLASAPTRLDVYNLPDDETAGVMARSLREYGSSLLRGDLSLIPRLEQRIKERERRYQAEMQNRIRDN